MQLVRQNRSYDKNAGERFFQNKHGFIVKALNITCESDVGRTLIMAYFHNKIYILLATHKTP